MNDNLPPGHDDRDPRPEKIEHDESDDDVQLTPIKDQYEKLRQLIIDRMIDGKFEVIEAGQYTVEVKIAENEFELRIQWWIANGQRYFSSYDNSNIWIGFDANEQEVQNELFEIVERAKIRFLADRQ